MTEDEVLEFAKELMRLVGPIAVQLAKEERERPGFIETYMKHGMEPAIKDFKSGVKSE